MGYKGRDVEIIDTGSGISLVIACDSCGSVGSKELDLIKAPPEIVGRLTARTVLMELVSVGATPVVMTVSICAEPFPTGEKILMGIKDELQVSGLSDLKLVVSSEKNFETRQTGIGIGATGICQPGALKIARSKAADNIFCLGAPRVGDEVIRSGCMDRIHSGTLNQLRPHPLIKDILPVGSKGIRVEAELLASQSGTIFNAAEDCRLDLGKSAGPSTCVLFSSSESLEEFNHLEIYHVGQLI